jgi:hypothetical protein
VKNTILKSTPYESSPNFCFKNRRRFNQPA